MVSSLCTSSMDSTNTSAKEQEDEFQQLLSTLPKEKNWDGTFLYLYQGFWCPSIALKAVVSFQKHFRAHDSDLILSSTPKSGTTWLKGLAYLITNRTCFPLGESPLLTSSPHDLVSFIEFDLYLKNHSPDLETRPKPRIFATHTPYPSLPSSIKDSKCKIVYVCRNPLDQFISHWQFLLKLRRENMDPISLEEAFDKYCQGIHSFGPFSDHVLGYWQASLETPEKVLFLKYEDMKDDILASAKKLAEFMGFPFSKEEEEKGVIEEITKMCSFEEMKNLEVNKSGRRPSGAPNSAFFRKGEVGDWENYLTPSMAEKMDRIIEAKLEGSGFKF